MPSITAISVTAATSAVRPTRASLRRLNSRPRENIRKTTPSSDSVWMVCSSWISDERRRVRPDDDPGEDVAEHHRLLEPVEEDGDEAGDHHDHRQVLDEVDGVHPVRRE